MIKKFRTIGRLLVDTLAFVGFGTVLYFIWIATP